MAMNLWPHFFGPTLYLVTQLIKCYGLRKHTQPTCYKLMKVKISTAQLHMLLSSFPFPSLSSLSHTIYFFPYFFPPPFPIRFHDPLIRANLLSALPGVVWWCSSQGVGLATPTVAGSTPDFALSGKNLGQVVHTYVLLSLSSIIWYRSRGDVLRLER